jgi:hypothetical protein
MNVHAGVEPAHLREHARRQTQVVTPKPMRDAVNPHRPQPRIAKQHLQPGARSRVALQTERMSSRIRQRSRHKIQGTVGTRDVADKRAGNQGSRIRPVPWSLIPYVPLSLPFLRRHRNRLGLQGQRLLAQRLKEHARQVALAEVGQHHHDQLAFAFSGRAATLSAAAPPRPS